jgi:hypothetical protein
MNIQLGSTSITVESCYTNCKLPASWSGELVVTKPAYPFAKEALHNSDNADTNYVLWEELIFGSVRHDTGIYNDAGATDGTTRISWKMVSNANAEYPLAPLRSPEIVQWNESTGSSKTVTVEIVHNSQGSGSGGALTDREAWLEVVYPAHATKMKVALASAGSAGTMIFDEIDRGVGGAVASAIGERLARLADAAQVLVVTHSPQVAARGHSQWRIEKASDSGITRTSLTLLATEARQEEIARMLSGADVTPEARAQALRLLEGA